MTAEQEFIDSHFGNAILALEETKLNGDMSLLGSCQKKLIEQPDEYVKT